MTRITIVLILLLSCFSTAIFAKTLAPENPFGEGVFIFDPSMSSNQINTIISKIYEQQRYNEFGNQRYAFLFMPGNYGIDAPVDVRVGYYTQVLGMGKKPRRVSISGAVRTQDESYGALTNFWRGVENLTIYPTLGAIDDPSIPKDQNVWAVSQASPMRRIRLLNGSLRLYQKGWSSGGFLANSKIKGTIYSGTQQQWLTRNSTFQKWDGSNWNIVFSGDAGQINIGQWPNPPYTVIRKTPIIREKPYLYYNEKLKQYVVNIRPLRTDIAGPDWSIDGTDIPLTDFYMAKPGTSAYDINQALAEGKHLFLTPGVYHLAEPIRIKRPNTIVFGLGFPTLVPDGEKPAMIISDVDGVQIAGVMFDAGPVKTHNLLLVGENKTNVSHQADPISLYDAFCRVGGPGYSFRTDTCFTINSNDVMMDDVWTWRADHVAGDGHLGWFVNQANNGIIVNGDNVIIFNLMSEHFQHYQSIFNGENARIVHYQSEMPYDVPNQAAWKNGDKNGYASYKVGDNVTKLRIAALGIYTYFRDAPVWSDAAIEAPAGKNICLQNVILFWLNGNDNSGIKHVVNADGPGVSNQSRRVDYQVWTGGPCP